MPLTGGARSWFFDDGRGVPRNYRDGISAHISRRSMMQGVHGKVLVMIGAQL